MTIHKVKALSKLQLKALEATMREQHWMGSGHKCLDELQSSSKVMGDSCLIARLLATIRKV